MTHKKKTSEGEAEKLHQQRIKINTVQQIFGLEAEKAASTTN
jgi:hypothetical protein